MAHNLLNILAMKWGLLFFFAAVFFADAQTLHPSAYTIGTPNVLDVWVDPVSGNDGNSGLTRTQAFQSVTTAWNLIPMSSTLTNGYRINLVAGTHTNRPNYWESRYGTFTNPVIIQAVDGAGTAIMDTMNVFDCRYLYLIGIRLEIGGGDVLHLDSCDHVLVRNMEIVGTGDIYAYDSPQEALKVNQSQYLYVEGSDISGAYDNAVDCVAVQYGHFLSNTIHRALDWCMYLKGGSAYFTVEGNEFYDGGTGGFTAGQGTGFEYMVNPWIHYEAYDIKFINNVIHHTGTAGLGVNGGYNILMAYNTLYKCGTNDHAIEVVHGSRSCDGDIEGCSSNNAAGGWGVATAVVDEQYIPSRNVYIYNNLVYNPSGSRSDWNQFTVAGATTPPGGSNVSDPAVVDTNLYIRGNLIWNGPPDMTNLAIFSGGGCEASNPSCNETLVAAENVINIIEPQLVNPEGGDYRPVQDGNVYDVTLFAIPEFPGGDRPSTPLSPSGNLTNSVTLDATGVARSTNDVPGAFANAFEMEIESLNLTGSSVITWTSATNYIYTLSRSTNLLNGFAVNVQTQLVGTPPLNIVTDITATGSGPYFYRIQAE